MNLSSHFLFVKGDDDFDTRSLEERIGITGAIKSKLDVPSEIRFCQRVVLLNL